MAMTVRGDGGSATPPEARGARLAGSGSKVAVWASRARSHLLFMTLDAVAVVVAFGLAEVSHFPDRPPAAYWRHFAGFAALALVVFLGSNKLFGLYGRIWRHAGVEEARQVVLSTATALGVLLVLRPLWRATGLELVPVDVVVIGTVFVVVAMSVLRFHSRLFAWQRGSRRAGLRVAVIGSRDAGAAAVREMLRSPGAGLVPVAVFDDDGRGHGLSLLGVPVVGSIEDIPDSVDRYMIQQVFLAIPNPAPDLVERALEACEAADLVLKILPSVRDIVAGRPETVAVRRAREPQIADLLGRESVHIDLGSVGESLRHLRVLVTGAGGSIGSEIVRQVASFEPAELLLLDHDETHLHDVGLGLTVKAQQLLVDVADRGAVFEAFLDHHPDVVFHAAAHKHVPVLEDHPVEAARVNVIGTQNVVDAAEAAGVRRFVLISTDKAVKPVSVMGASKQLAEQVVLGHQPAGAAYCAVRFGNVLGSRGSVIPTFANQIAAGGPVTVTDRRMTRFFMSVEEAVQLVLQASVLSEGGEVFMLEMGKPVRIVDVAERMIRLSGYEVGTDIAIEFIGARPGEKLHEELYDGDEEILPTSHPSIRRVVPVVRRTELDDELALLEAAASQRDAGVVRRILFAATSPEDATPVATGPEESACRGVGSYDRDVAPA